MKTKKIGIDDVKRLVEYEKVREAERDRIIALKKTRRVSLGDNLTLLFENRDTVLFQIQEMIRTERLVEAAKIQDELDVYNALLPSPSELSATLFIEIPELSRMGHDEVRRTVNRFQGLDHDCVWLEAGSAARVPARFEAGHSNEEKMAAVHYVRFPISHEVRAALAENQAPVHVVVNHANYKATATLPAELRKRLLADLAEAAS